MEINRKLFRSNDEVDDLFFRSFELNRAKLDDNARTIPVTFSTETPVRRWGWDEYLLHGKDNVNLSRLKATGSVLLNHNPSFIVGPVKDPRIEDSQGRALAGFDNDEDGNKAMGKVKSGSLKGVSVGYSVQKFREVQRDEEFELPGGRKIKGPAMVATRWSPHEISLTPIPADPNSKVGRMLTRSLDGIEIERSTLNQEEETMKKDEVQALIDESLARLEIPKTDEIVSKVTEALREASKPKMRMEPEVFQDLLGRAGAVSLETKSKVADMAVDGKTEGEILRFINDEALGRTDTSDTGDLGHGFDQQKGKTRTGHGQEYKVADMEDDDFVRMITEVSEMPVFTD